MSGHDFEKQVRQKLNDLKMKPSAKAWENIEESLREKKRRLVPVFWLSLLLIGLAAGGYLFLKPADSEEQVASIDAKTPAVAPPQKNVSTIPENKPDVATGIAPQQTLVQQENKPVQPKNTFAPQEKTVVAKQNVFAPRENKPGVTSIKVFNKDLSQEKTNSTTLQSKNLSAPQALAPQTLTNSEALSGFNKIPTLNLSTEKSIVNAPSLPSYNTSSPKPAVQKKKMSKWSYGLSGVAGVSSVSEGDFFNLNLNRAEVEDVAQIAAFAPQPYRPSSISSGFTYSLGGFVKRELSKKFSLSVGLNYLQLNTQNKVGSRINQRQVVNNGTRGYMLVSSYYTLQQDQPSEYRNRYHFVEVPVELHTRINKSEKVQLFVNTGMAVSRLLKSNSLHFDGSSGVYYKNDRLLNQTQVATKIGMSFGLLNNTTRPIWVGPYARYNISRILQKDVSASKSFASFGIDMKLFIR